MKFDLRKQKSKELLMKEMQKKYPHLSLEELAEIVKVQADLAKYETTYKAS